MNSVVDEFNEASLFRGLNLVVMPVWLAMIVAPRSGVTARIVRWSDGLLAGLAAVYAAQLGMSVATSDAKMDFGDVAALREALGSPSGFLTGWTHFLAFDLFVGRWIWRTALDEGRNSRIALFLTLIAGPAGLGWFGLQRRSLSPASRPAGS
ncbi:ABA4-like family protein [Actinospongicola halichondriae]|uniref:ABA4-like family protein n=1 Tax=Actinospongicola halichondriae TaxID=3236844 RepID=UPI003D56CD1E